jgi:hypothetical protein
MLQVLLCFYVDSMIPLETLSLIPSSVVTRACLGKTIERFVPFPFYVSHACTMHYVLHNIMILIYHDLDINSCT